MIIKLKELAQDEKGATILDYSVIAAFIAGAILTFFTDLNQEIFNLFSEIWDALDDF